MWMFPFFLQFFCLSIEVKEKKSKKKTQIKIKYLIKNDCILTEMVAKKP